MWFTVEQKEHTGIVGLKYVVQLHKHTSRHFTAEQKGPKGIAGLSIRVCER
jgi:hypothetical protein